MITTQHVFFLIGAMFAAYAVLSLTDRTNPKRLGNAAFWGLLAVSLIGGTWIGDFANGLIVLALAGIASANLLGRGQPEVSEEQRAANGERYGDKLFLPILVVLLTAVAGTLLFLYVPPLAELGWFEAKRETLVLLCAGVLLALAILYLWLRPPALAPLQEGRRLMDAVGWAAVLPLMLAAFGTVLKETGVGDLIGGFVGGVIPQGAVFPAVAAFGLGMALFTILTGNAFAAFPIMASAIAVPLLLQEHGGDPAVVGAIGMLAGFCGTLMTPMAANFNLVPVTLLELKDPNAVIKAQIPTALPLLAINILFIWWFAF
jgi:uncharacterized membrane protein